jgi:molybdopterin-containing oxidoreductase family membrane subunit
MNNIKTFGSLVIDSFKVLTEGRTSYHIWMSVLTALMLVGAYSYSIQLDQGLSSTGMSDKVSWGLYISNFTFLVGVAAAAVMLVLPTYVLKDVDFSKAVLIGEGLAIAALIMCMAFVTVDMGGPARLWHLIPGIGVLNFPNSMLSWDILVLMGYLLLNISIPFYILFMRYQGKEPKRSIYLPGVIISVFWAVGIHMVTAFLYQGLQSRPFWNTALLGPRFLASAFAAGPALIIIALSAISKFSEYKTDKKTISKIAMIATVAAQINLVMLISELFKEFYAPTHHSISAQYLYFGIGEHNALVPWIWTAITLNVTATAILTIHKLRQKSIFLFPALIMLFLGIWIEKGFGLIIPGFIPGQWGEIVEYLPTGIEIAITIGVWAMGAFIFSALVKVGTRIELGKLRLKKN